jgi:ribonucleoside-diphosphate reductase alpha chain
MEFCVVMNKIHSMALDLDLHINTSYFNDPAVVELMKTRGIMQADETLESVFVRLLRQIIKLDEKLQGSHDPHFLSQLIEFTEKGIFCYGSPVLTNMGRSDDLPSASSTVLIAPQLANRELDTKRLISISAPVLEKAIGVGYDLSGFDDPVAALQEINNQIYKIGEYLVLTHRRPVAAMATLRADHPRVFEFISMKNDADFSKWRFNISLFMTEQLFNNLMEGKDIELKGEDGSVAKVVSGKEYMDQITRSIHRCGEPGILFKDRFEQDNPTPQWPYLSTAPCAEAAMHPGEVCQFSYINLAPLVTKNGSKVDFDMKKFQESVTVMTRFLDAALEQTITSSDNQFELAGEKRRIGIGITGFADLLMKLDIPYNSEEAVKLAKYITEMLWYTSKWASIDLAQERGAFPVFKQSRLTDPKWVRRKHSFITDQIPAEKWEELYKAITTKGIRHASTVIFPPTGTSSQINRVSPSFEPFLSLCTPIPLKAPEARTETYSRTVLPVVSEALRRHASSENQYQEWMTRIMEPINNGKLPDIDANSVFATADQMPFDAHLRVYAAFQHFADDSSSKTFNMANTTTFEEIKQVLISAHKSGLKGCAIFRDRCLEERGL